MDNSYGIQNLQEANLRIMDEIDRICRKYGIRYMLDSGTLIGAVRHGGFIPWDDDMDIAMTRKEWERFRTLAPRELPAEMELILPEQLADFGAFYDFTARVILKPSRRRPPDEESAWYHEITNHLWVDIFLIDRIPDDPVRDFLMRTEQKVIYALAMAYRFRVDESKYSTFHRLCVRAGRLLGRLVPVRTLVRWQDRAGRRYAGKQTKRVFYSTYQPDYLYVTLERRWTEDLTEIGFEGRQYRISACYDEILKEVYGDYMKLPPEEARKPSHAPGEALIYDD